MLARVDILKLVCILSVVLGAELVGCIALLEHPIPMSAKISNC